MNILFSWDKLSDINQKAWNNVTFSLSISQKYYWFKSNQLSIEESPGKKSDLEASGHCTMTDLTVMDIIGTLSQLRWRKSSMIAKIPFFLWLFNGGTINLMYYKGDESQRRDRERYAFLLTSLSHILSYFYPPLYSFINNQSDWTKARYNENVGTNLAW